MLYCTFAQLINPKVPVISSEGNKPATNSKIETILKNQVKSCDA